MAAIKTENLVKRYSEVTAVNGVSLEIPEGEVFGLLGPNGAGKTTLISMLATLVHPTSGTALVAGHDINKEPLEVRKNIGIVFQEPSVDDLLTARENLYLHSMLYGMPRREINPKIDKMLALVNLTDRGDSYVKTYSGGMRRRLEIARGLIHSPKILFLDEPTSGVDPISRRNFWDLIRTMAREGVTVFVTTHYMDEAEYCDRLALIYKGRMIALGTPEELKREHMPEDVLEVAADRPVEALELLPRLAMVREAAMFGTLLHVVVPDAGKDGPAVRAALDEAGIRVERMEKILPSLEDVFVSLIEAEDRAEARAAAA